MGKQAAQKSTALVNALAKADSAPKAAPVQKEVPAPAPTPKRKPKVQAEEPVQKTKAQIEAEQAAQLAENARAASEFYIEDQERKARERKGADNDVTYVPDKDSRKPKAVNDLSDFWRQDLGFMPFMPNDNAGVEASQDDVANRAEYLTKLNEQLQKLLKMKFHVFWSQVLYDDNLRRTLDSYLRFCLRSHDVAGSAEASNVTGNASNEEKQLAQDISRRMLLVCVRLGTPKENDMHFMSDKAYGKFIRQHSIFDVPKLIDLCAIYGDSNRTAVTKIVHNVFAHQPCYAMDFKEVAHHMTESLEQCCAPLHMPDEPSNEGAAELSIMDCLAFLPDVLSCFNAIFCFFPDECRELLLGGGLKLADLMALLHEGVRNLEEAGEDLLTVRSLLCRLLSYVLGFQMSPRHGASAFEELLQWCKGHFDAGRTALLLDLGKYGLENTMLEWMATGQIDDARLDFLESMCGEVLPAVARRRAKGPGRAMPARSGTEAAPARGGGASGSGGAAGSGDAPTDAAKVREVREILGKECGDGFILQCLLHYSFSVPAVVSAVLDGNLPPQLACLPRDLRLDGAPGSAPSQPPQLFRETSAEDRKRVKEQHARMEREAAEEAQRAAAEAEYDDDFHEGGAPAMPRVAAGRNHDSSDSEKAGSGDSSDDGKGGAKGKGKGKGKGKSWEERGPVQGQTYAARRKEQNKGKFKSQAYDRKMQKAM